MRSGNRVLSGIGARPVAVFLDFDGTLAAIRRRPSAASLSKAARKTLKKIAGEKRISVAIISGRGLSDITKRVGVKGLVYAGNHGLEIRGKGIKYTAPGARKARKAIAAIGRKAAKAYAGIKGVIVEDKNLSLSIHYRMAGSSKAPLIERTIREFAGPFLRSGSIRLTRGKKTWEVRPAVDWNKGKAVLFLLGRSAKRSGGESFPIYIGDDRTDEDAFRALRRRGLTVFVGKVREKTSAEYYLRSTGEVISFLRKVLHEVQKAAK